MYVTLDELRAIIPEDWLTQSLDDNSDGIIDAWDTVQIAAGTDVDAILSMRYRTPFATPPAIVRRAARVLAAEKCYLRRGVKGSDNPFTAQADAMRKLLERIAEGKISLHVDIERSRPSVSVITSPSKTHSEQNTL